MLSFSPDFPPNVVQRYDFFLKEQKFLQESWLEIIHAHEWSKSYVSSDPIIRIIKENHTYD